MKSRRLLVAVIAVAATLSLLPIASAAAATPTFPATFAAGGVVFRDQATLALVTFSARATGPALPGQDHQPATGFLSYRNAQGLTFAVAVQHIHAQSATEVHFGGAITSSSDPALVGQFAHGAAVDGGRGGQDQFAIVITSGDTCPCETGGFSLSPVLAGGLVVGTPGL